jgi:hypothetical protein
VSLPQVNVGLVIRGSRYLLLLVFCELSSLNLTVLCDYVLQISRYVAI